MKTLNADIDRFLQYILDKELYIYGVGDVFDKLKNREVYEDIHKSVFGYIDNGKAGKKIKVYEREYTVHAIDFLKTLKKGVVLLCGIKYLDEMYRMLCEQELPDGIECFILPLIWAVSGGQDDSRIKNILSKDNNSQNKIDKKIHCFWFSNDKKPKEYQYCMDSWKRVCPEYEIIEWNANNYNYDKNVFMRQAYESKKWAFVSDYARLDVIYHYGGIYLDMDVELLKTLDPLLKFEAFFNFGTQNDIDLGSGFGSVKGNILVKKLLDLYDGIEFWDENGTPLANSFIQPELLRKEFQKNGVSMNGKMQLINDILFLPRKYATPIDDFFLQNYVLCDDSRSIHHYNAGWWTKEWHDERKNRLEWIELAKNMI